MFQHHIERIEHPDFQIQFVALSGLSVLQLVLSSHANVKSLLADLSTGHVQSQELYKRILYLLPLVAEEKEFSYDGSVVTYLYCLAENEPDRAFKASLRILQTKGLFWSRQLARAFAETYEKHENAANLGFSSGASEPFAFELTEHDFPSIQNFAHNSSYLIALGDSLTITRGFKYRHDLNERVPVLKIPIGLSTDRPVFQDANSPTQDFVIANVV